MRKIFLFTVAVFLCFQSVWADDHNPFFGDHRHQVALSLGWGTGNGFIVPPPAYFVPFAEAHVQYSVPSTMFYFPGRFSLNITQTIGLGRGRGWDWRDLSIPIVYLTQDVALLQYEDFYFGAGGGGGFQVQENSRIGSKLIFTLKLFIGYNITESFAMEVYVKHFSNGNTAPENNSYAFYGLSATYSF